MTVYDILEIIEQINDIKQRYDDASYNDKKLPDIDISKLVDFALDYRDELLRKQVN